MCAILQSGRDPSSLVPPSSRTPHDAAGRNPSGNRDRKLATWNLDSEKRNPVAVSIAGAQCTPLLREQFCRGSPTEMKLRGRSVPKHVERGRAFTTAGPSSVTHIKSSSVASCLPSVVSV